MMVDAFKWKYNYNGVPCGKKCPDRCVSPNCHATCEKYLKWKAEHDALKGKYDRKKRVDSEFDAYRLKQVTRSKKGDAPRVTSGMREHKK